MSLFGTIQIAQNTLIASSIGMQVAGNNIANAASEGYIRQEAAFTPGPTQLIGNLPLGLGVRVDGIIQQIDKYLQDRFRNATSDAANSGAQEDVYLKLEAVLGELNDTDLSTSINAFFGSVNDILNQPESVSVRNLAVLKGQTLSDDIQRFASRVRDIRAGANEKIVGAADDINRLSQEIATLNVEIVGIEAGATTGSDAVGLRDQREQALESLAKILDINAVEQQDGSVTVFTGGDYLVAQGTSRGVSIAYSSDRGMTVGEIRLDETDAPLAVTGSGLAGLMKARDQILGGVLDAFDNFTGTLVNEFNKIYSSGQGLSGYSRVTSEFNVDNVDTALDSAGLKFTPTNGSFKVVVHNKETGLNKTYDIVVKLNGLEDDTTLSNLANQIDAIDGLSTSLSATRDLTITSDSPQLEFSFADDTSGTLAALGINTFFSGSRASDVGVNQDVVDDPSKFAASQGGIGHDAANVTLLAALQDTPITNQNGESIGSLYHGIAASITQGSSKARSVAEGFRVFQKTLEGEKLGVSGVNIDDESIQIIQYQRMYQASARLISTINDLLETLIQL